MHVAYPHCCVGISVLRLASPKFVNTRWQRSGHNITYHSWFRSAYGAQEGTPVLHRTFNMADGVHMGMCIRIPVFSFTSSYSRYSLHKLLPTSIGDDVQHIAINNSHTLSP